MGNTETYLSTYVGTSFATAKRTAAIVNAQAQFGTVDGESNDRDLATAMLAMAILLNRRQAEKGKTDPSIAVLDIDKLVTPEMERLLNKTNVVSTMSFLISHQQPKRHWSS